MTEAASSGVIEGAEHEMISGVLRLGDRSARAVMTPRTDVEWLDASLPDAELMAELMKARHSRIPLMEGGSDNIVGVVQLRELLPALLAGQPWNLKDFIRDVPGHPRHVAGA